MAVWYHIQKNCLLNYCEQFWCFAIGNMASIVKTELYQATFNTILKRIKLA